VNFTPGYREYFRSIEWATLRAWCVGRARGCCECCTSDGTLHGHHLTYERFRQESDEDILILCKKCHHRATDLVRGRVIPRVGSPERLRQLTLEAINPRKRHFSRPMFTANPMQFSLRGEMDFKDFRKAFKKRFEHCRGSANLLKACSVWFFPERYRKAPWAGRCRNEQA
jgi:hypothetical protein